MDARMDEAPALFRLDGFPSSLETNALPPGSNPVTLTRPVQGGPGAFCPQIYLGGGGISCHLLQYPAHGAKTNTPSRPFCRIPGIPRPSCRRYG